MLALKLGLVPTFLLLVSLAGRRWGPRTAGWLAGMPVVTGPILFILALERGTAFTAGAATTSLSAVFATLAYGAVYSRASLRLPWFGAFPVALIAWLSAVALLSALPHSLAMSIVVALVSLACAGSAFPDVPAQPGTHVAGPFELALRMLAGAVLTVAVTRAADVAGPAWIGLFAVFPVMGVVLSVFSHRTDGARFTVRLLRSMMLGMYAFAAFCLTIALTLEALGTAVAFPLALAAALGAQLATGRHMARSVPRPAVQSGRG
jgi:hypothetical protein